MQSRIWWKIEGVNGENKMENERLTLSECLRRLSKTKFKYLELTLFEFADFIMIISPNDCDKLDFTKPKWHGSEIRIIERVND